VAKEFIVTRQRSLDDFNVEYAQLVNTKIVKAEAGNSMVTLYKIKGHDFLFYLVMGDFAEDMIQGRTCPIAVACLRKARFLWCATPLL
jgi:hypothetical protein